MKSIRIQHLSKAAFSLVEVTLAMGIAALGIIAVLGLMPQGMEMSRRTGEMSAHRQINEQVINNLSQKSWSELRSMSGGSETAFWFDDQGLETTSSGDMRAILAVLKVSRLDATPTLPDGMDREEYLVKVTVKIATTTNPAFDFSDLNRKNFVTTTHYIARTK